MMVSLKLQLRLLSIATLEEKSGGMLKVVYPTNLVNDVIRDFENPKSDNNSCPLVQ